MPSTGTRNPRGVSTLTASLVRNNVCDAGERVMEKGGANPLEQTASFPNWICEVQRNANRVSGVLIRDLTVPFGSVQSLRKSYVMYLIKRNLMRDEDLSSKRSV
ncbi:hypothetical protein EVAR_5254_1 [Eumeta japonica]|uniref:Uncharacterized protein n=1 Tax=Eumeta variegata TaxID=151549 RepID=A0A4C1XNP7_EUMVA|nr:hypothetical protein EVAR_5254_1 [Eumeta japonica]